jgi:hypothetical protein
MNPRNREEVQPLLAYRILGSTHTAADFVEMPMYANTLFDEFNMAMRQLDGV